MYSNHHPVPYARQSDNVNNNNNNNGPRAKCEQVVSEALAKACEIIVTSRCSAILGPTSNRFNLQTKQVDSVRQILARTKLMLHMPYRLDVFAENQQAPPFLLERWSLEYPQSGMERFLEREGTVLGDPIVQLRYVCKRIVIWLRTLCCATRFLPAQRLKKNANIGFSLYVPEEHEENLMEQGFVRCVPSSDVVTPYGTLHFQVYHAPVSQLETFIPRTTVKFVTPTPSIPIPTHRAHPTRDEPRPMFPQSAPAAQANAMMAVHHTAGALVSSPRLQQQTYDPSRLHQRSHSTIDGSSATGETHPKLNLLQRRNTSIGDADSDRSPERVLSGLSLALMMNEQDEARRAAFHDAPPIPKQQYGYAYNSHIPWQTIHPAQTHPAHTAPKDSSAPPMPPMSSTPPRSSSPYALASTPPSVGAIGGGGVLSNVSLAHLLPPQQPQQRSAVLSPPFAPRPVGLVAAEHKAELGPFSREAMGPSTSAQHQQQKQSPYAHVLPPVLPYDRLPNSPFEMASSEHPMSSLSESNLRRSLFSIAASTQFHRPNNYDDDDNDMPFAVDEDQPPFLLGAAAAASSSVAASWSNRKLSFQPADSDVQSLANQLAEFQAFGASLHQSSGDNNSSRSASTISLRT